MVFIRKVNGEESYICGTCGSNIQYEGLTETVRHESLPIEEGGFNHVVLKGKQVYFLYLRTNKLDFLHDRIYREFTFDTNSGRIEWTGEERSVSDLVWKAGGGKTREILTPKEFLEFKSQLERSGFVNTASKISRKPSKGFLSRES